jgi:hypothetical protein
MYNMLVNKTAREIMRVIILSKTCNIPSKVAHIEKQQEA